MEKINFQNGITPLNDTNLNKMQTNVEKAINEAQEIKEMEVLYENSGGLVAGAEGTAVTLSKSVSNFNAILIIHSEGGSIVNNKLNTTNKGCGIQIYWFGEGYQGTFYNNTIYKVIGLCRL